MAAWPTIEEQQRRGIDLDRPVPMRRRFKIIGLALIVACAVLAGLVILGVIIPLTPQAPPEWHQIHVGMHRSKIVGLVGRPQSGMYPEKTVEAWYRDGPLGLRRLEVVYQNYADDRATIVREYIYWRPSQRYIYTRKEP